MSIDRITLPLLRMREEALNAVAFLGSLDHQEFLDDIKTQHAIAMTLIVLGEIATQLDRDHPDFTAQNPTLPWVEMRAMRNAAAHGYHKLEFESVWLIVKIALPKMIAQLDSIIPTRDLSGVDVDT